MEPITLEWNNKIFIQPCQYSISIQVTIHSRGMKLCKDIMRSNNKISNLLKKWKQNISAEQHPKFTHQSKQLVRQFITNHNSNNNNNNKAFNSKQQNFESTWKNEKKKYSDDK
jgi:hypothetical protein